MSKIEISSGVCEDDCGGSYLVTLDGEWIYCILMREAASTNRAFRFLADAGLFEYEWRG